MSLKDAVRMLVPFLPKASDVGPWLFRHITSGEVAITCRLLTYRKHGAGMAARERHEWPGPDARLAEQIEKALAQPLSGFTVLPGTVDLQWLDVTGGHAVDTHMSLPHVDRAALLSFFPDLQPPGSVEQPPVAGAPPPERAIASDAPAESLTTFVRTCAVDEPSWTVAYREKLKPAQAAGRFAKVSRTMFQREYAKVFPAPKPGRKPGG